MAGGAASALTVDMTVEEPSGALAPTPSEVPIFTSVSVPFWDVSTSTGSNWMAPFCHTVITVEPPNLKVPRSSPFLTSASCTMPEYTMDATCRVPARTLTPSGLVRSRFRNVEKTFG